MRASSHARAQSALPPRRPAVAGPALRRRTARVVAQAGKPEKTTGNAMLDSE
jgi:hypothetical protein